MIERLLTFSTSELCDGASNPRPMDYHIKPWVGEKRIAGRAVTCPTAAKNGTGQMNVPVDCGGVRVQPGDLIVGDENGVCVIDPKEAEAIMEKAEKKRAAQERTMREMEETGVLYTRIKK